MDTSRGTPAAGLFEPAMLQLIRNSSTSSVPSSTVSTSMQKQEMHYLSARGSWWFRPSMWCCAGGAIPISRSGRCAGSRGTIRIQGHVLGCGRPWSAACVATRRDRTCRNDGGPLRMKSTTMCARNGVNASGQFTQFYGSDNLDASLLLLPLFRFLPSNDDRLRSTVLAIASDLTDNGLVQRYRVDVDRRRTQGARVEFHRLLLLAGLGFDRDRRDRPCT